MHRYPKPFWTFALILLLGAGLRLAVVNTHGLDGDEGFSLNMAQRPLRELVEDFAADKLDLHPKLYYVLLHAWIKLTGTGQIGLRLPNVLADLVLGAFVMQTARRLFGIRPALVAGVLWSVNPLLIWVDGQVRMYALLALLATLAWLALLRAWITPRPAWWVLFGLAALGAAYTQIMGAVVLAAAGAVVVWWALRQRRVTGPVVLGTVGALYLPYARIMWKRRGTHPQLAQYAPETVPDFIRQFFGSLIAHGLPVNSGALWAVAALTLALLVWAWWSEWRAYHHTPNLHQLKRLPGGLPLPEQPSVATLPARGEGLHTRRFSPSPFTGRGHRPKVGRGGVKDEKNPAGMSYTNEVYVTGALLLIVGITTVGVAYFAFGADVFRTKYFVYVVPVIVLALAVGITRLSHRLTQGLVLVALLAGSVAGLTRDLAPTARDDFPAAAAFIETHGDSGDLIIVTSNYGEAPFRYYYAGASDLIAPWYSLSPDMALDDLFAFVIQGYDTAWLVSYLSSVADPRGLMDAWFRARYPQRTEIFPLGVTVRAYDLRPMTDDLPPEAAPLDETFGERVTLRGYQVYVDSVARRDYRLHPPSGWVHVTLYWEVLEPGTAFEPRLQVEGDTGAMFGGPLQRGTGTTAFFPPATWEPGQVWRVDYDLNLNPDTPPGTYKIVLRVTGPDGSTWPLDGASDGRDWLILDRVDVTRR